jgi:hypothetical protein
VVTKIARALAHSSYAAFQAARSEEPSVQKRCYDQITDIENSCIVGCSGRCAGHSVSAVPAFDRFGPALRHSKTNCVMLRS